jgi:hypothetical protein
MARRSIGLGIPNCRGSRRRQSGDAVGHGTSLSAVEYRIREFGERFVSGYKAPSVVDLMMSAPFSE